jgi:hypothetical protein
MKGTDMKIDNNIIDWLLGSNAYVHYATRVNLLNENISKIETDRLISEMLKDTNIKNLFVETENYFPSIARRHTDSKLSHYKIRLLTDFGFTYKNGLKTQIDIIKQHHHDGKYAIRQTLPIKNYGQSIEWNALPCDNPLLLYIIKKSGAADKQTEIQIDSLKELWSSSKGWFCHLPFVESQFKKEQYGCPMAGLFTMELFSLDKELKESKYSKNAFDTLVYHYELGKSIYYFGRGKKFYTFKYPFVWYNALYLGEVLTKFSFARKHILVKDIVKWIESGQDNEGKYKPTSIFLEYKNWDFGNKKECSPWITYLCYKILKQYYEE